MTLAPNDSSVLAEAQGFDFDETGLAAGCAVMVQIAREFLS